MIVQLYKAVKNRVTNLSLFLRLCSLPPYYLHLAVMLSVGVLSMHVQVSLLHMLMYIGLVVWN